MIALVIASWTPGDSMVRTGISGALEHAAAYLLTGIAVILGHPNRSAWTVSAMLALYAGVLELGQTIAPGRHAAFADWLAGGVGALFAALLMSAARYAGRDPRAS
jgi:VanZ family protein